MKSKPPPSSGHRGPHAMSLRSTRNQPANLGATPTTTVAPKDMFANLNLNVRYMIWDLLLPDRRFVPVTSFLSLEDYEAGKDKHNSTLWDHVSARANLPVGLQINQESRTHFKRTYKLMFNMTLLNRPIYFNPKKDILLMMHDYETTFRQLDTGYINVKAVAELKNIRENVLSVAFAQEDSPASVVAQIEEYFPNVKKVIFSEYNIYQNMKLAKDRSGEFTDQWVECYGEKELPKIRFIDFGSHNDHFVLDPINSPGAPTHRKGIQELVGTDPEREFKHLKGVLKEGLEKDERVTIAEYLDPGNKPCGCGQHDNARACRFEGREEGAYHTAYAEWEEEHDGDEDDFEWEWNELTEKEFYFDDDDFVEYWLKYD